MKKTRSDAVRSDSGKYGRRAAKVTVNQKIESLNQLLDQGNLMLMEVIAHQLKGVFEQMNAVELKNLVFKMELEIRKDRVEKVAGYLKRITEIWLLMKADNEWEN